MTKLLQLLPQDRETTVEAIVAAAKLARNHHLPLASSEAKRFCAELSQRLLNDSEARLFPELQALGFWLRPASIDGMPKRYLQAPEGACRAPAGVVLQLPPGNVSTLFGYTSSIALLCGNVTMIRLPQAQHSAQILLTTFMREILEDSGPALRERLIVLRYGHDDAITERLSLASDARLVWGGDATVDHIRRLPLPPLARHVSFGDRFSASAIKAESYCALNETARAKLIKKLFNDIYLFDQMACASPRLLAWIGSEDATKRAENDFYPRLSAYAASRGYAPGAGEAVAKLNAVYLALHDLSPVAYQVFGPHLSVIALPDLARMSAFKTVSYGYGLLMTVRLESLQNLARYAERRDQSLIHFGLTQDEISDFITTCQGRGFDRVVAAGQALAFDPVWDGYNLFDVMTRLIGVRP